jgi:tRNA wybutosine-synthesizing protein 2
MTDDTQEMETQESRIVFVVPKQHVKTVKTVLEKHGQLDRTSRIVPEERPSSPSTPGCENKNIRINLNNAKTPNADKLGQSEQRMRIPTTIPYEPDHEDSALNLSLTPTIFQDPALLPIVPLITLSLSTVPTIPPQTNPLHKALTHAISALPPSTLADLHLTPSTLVSAFPVSYSIYPPLLLLPAHALSSAPWKLLSTNATALSSLWPAVTTAMHVSHMALNSPIPASTAHANEENILRSPFNITPLYGAFGPNTHHAVPAFASALWVSATQNGIRQTWSPLHTMFSRGNMREKTRVLSLPGIRASTVVDMYAGIGYFAFSYKQAGAGLLVCFELNAWSVEGLRRGARMNGWSVRVVSEQDLEGFDGHVAGVDFLVCHMSNTHAVAVLARIRDREPIRHVNLGLLPRSRDSWRDAVALLGRAEGGWVHAHENVGVGEMVDRKREIEGVFQGYAGKTKVEVRHVERVKMYAPGVVHCVFDVWVEGVEE